MLDPSEFEQRRAPSAFRESAKALNGAVRVNGAERRLGLRKVNDVIVERLKEKGLLEDAPPNKAAFY